MTCYFMAIVIVSASFTILNIFIVEMCKTVTQSFRVGQNHMCHYNRKPIHDLLFDDNSNFYPDCHHFQDIHCRSVRDLDLDLQNEPRLNVIAPIDSLCNTYCWMAIVTVTISYTFIVEMTLTLTFKIDQDQM